MVVLERQDFVVVLQEIDYLRQDRANLDQQIAAYAKSLEALTAKVADQAALIEQVEAQIETERKKQAVLDEERKRLQAELASQGFWSSLKDYGLVGLSVAVVILAIL